MVGPTLVSTGDRVDNDNLKKVGVLGAYNLPIIEWTRELVTDSAHAGETLMPPTGAGGEDKRQLADDKTTRCDSIMEWDPGQAAGVSTDQAAGDEIIILPLNMNTGAIFRNVQHADPNANVDAMSPLCTISGAQGSLDTAIEATLSNSTPYGFHKSATAWGLNPENGTISSMTIDALRTIAMKAYYIADPGAAYTDVIIVRW
jgi:hypothetical protein